MGGGKDWGWGDKKVSLEEFMSTLCPDEAEDRRAFQAREIACAKARRQEKGNHSGTLGNSRKWNGHEAREVSGSWGLCGSSEEFGLILQSAGLSWRVMGSG